MASEQTAFFICDGIVSDDSDQQDAVTVFLYAGPTMLLERNRSDIKVGQVTVRRCATLLTVDQKLGGLYFGAEDDREGLSPDSNVCKTRGFEHGADLSV